MPGRPGARSAGCGTGLQGVAPRSAPRSRPARSRRIRMDQRCQSLVMQGDTGAGLNEVVDAVFEPALRHRRDWVTTLSEINLEGRFSAYRFVAGPLVERAVSRAPDRATGGSPALNQLPVAQHLLLNPGSSMFT